MNFAYNPGCSYYTCAQLNLLPNAVSNLSSAWYITAEASSPTNTAINRHVR